MRGTQETWVWSLGGEIPWRRRWQPSPVFLPGESNGQRSLAGYRPRGRKEVDMTERLPPLPVLRSPFQNWVSGQGTLSTGKNWMPQVPQCIQQATRPSLASSSSCHKPRCLSLSPRQQSTLHLYSASCPKSGSPNADSYLRSESAPVHSAWMWHPGSWYPEETSKPLLLPSCQALQLRLPLPFPRDHARWRAHAVFDHLSVFSIIYVILFFSAVQGCVSKHECQKHHHE